MSITLTPQTIPTGTYSVDPTHSNVGFEVRHMGIATVRGQFKQFTGAIDATGDAPRLEGSVEVASIDTGEENRDGHLQAPDFFDVQQFPQITFHSTQTEATAEGGLKLVGEITIKGATKPIELTGELAENRREFGLKWNQTLPNGNLLVSNEVKLVISVSAVKAA
jgi:polyisoprenoid-binding protein YceI